MSTITASSSAISVYMLTLRTVRAIAPPPPRVCLFLIYIIARPAGHENVASEENRRKCDKKDIILCKFFIKLQVRYII